MPNEPRQPSHQVLVVTNPDRGRNEKPYFLRIGAAWPTQDGKGFFVKLHAVPVSGELVLKEPLPDDEPDHEQPEMHHRDYRAQNGRR